MGGVKRRGRRKCLADRPSRDRREALIKWRGALRPRGLATAEYVVEKTKTEGIVHSRSSR